MKKIFDDDSKYWETNCTLGNSSKRNLSDLFFFSFLQIMINSEFSKSITSSDRTMYRRYDKLFDSYKHFIKTYFNEEKNKLLDLICDFAKKFKEVINCEASEENIIKEFGLNRINNVIFSLNQSTLIPLILYIEFFNESLNERNKIYGLLETLIVRRMVSNESAKNYNNFFTETLISKGYMYNSIYNEIKEAEKRAPGFIPNDQTIKERLKTLKFDNKKSKGILFFLESRIHSNKDASNLYPFRKYELEHIMPKKWNDEWPRIKDFSDSKMDKLIKNIGNHTLLTKKLNSEYKNKSWKTKGPKLKKYSNGLHLIDSIDFTKQWDEQTINERSEELGYLICEHWPKF